MPPNCRSRRACRVDAPAGARPLVPMEPPLIELDNGWKKFSRTIASNRKRLSRSIMRSSVGIDPNPPRLRKNEYWALEGIYLALDRGQSVGLLGRNGAGKSTLLQVLAGHMGLDHGALTTRGRIVELITLAAGFQPLLSGRENIALGGLLRGLTTAQIRAREAEIIDFAEIEDMIDAPFATYSMGMKMRLAFAVNVFTDPDIMLIDELIGVGDVAFRQKSLARLEQMRDRCAIVLCTHSTGTLSRFCEFGIILDRGKMAFAGTAQDAVQTYLDAEDGSTPGTPSTIATLALDDDQRNHTFRNDSILKGVEADWRNQLGEQVATFEENETAILAVFAAFHPVSSRELTRFVIYLTDREGNRVGHTSVRARPSPRSTIEVDLALDLSPLSNGHYNVELRIHRDDETIYVAPLSPLLINRQRESWGPIALKGEWNVRQPTRNKPRADS